MKKDFEDDDFVLERVPDRLTEKQVEDFDRLAEEYIEALKEVQMKRERLDLATRVNRGKEKKRFDNSVIRGKTKKDEIENFIFGLEDGQMEQVTVDSGAAKHVHGGLEWMSPSMETRRILPCERRAESGSPFMERRTSRWRPGRRTSLWT